MSRTGVVRWAAIGLAIVVAASVLVPASAGVARAAGVSGRVVAWGSNRYKESAVPAGAAGAVQVAAGDRHSLALLADGSVIAWGDDQANQSSVPSAARGAVSIAAGALHSLALMPNGTVQAWGYNADGQTDVPSGLTNVIQVAAGGVHSLALTASGQVRAWGNDRKGQTDVPSGLSNVVQIAAGRYHSLALRADGTVVVWGANGDGQASPPSGLTNVVKVVGGVDHSLALKSDGTVVGWGSDLVGQSAPPSAATNVVDIAAGNRFSVAVTRSGTVLGWGYNSFGQVRPIPAEAAGATGLSAAGGHVLALTKVAVVPSPPTSNDRCGRASDEYYVPSVTGVVYQIDGKQVSAGWHSTTASVISISAIPAAGYTLTGTTSWTLRFTEDAGCLSLTAPTPKISGKAKAGKTLKLSTGKWKPAPVQLTTQWYRVTGSVRTAITGATGSRYTVKPSDGGSKILAVVTGSRSGYTTVSKTSKQTKTVPLSRITTRRPTISGKAVVGSTLVAQPGSWRPTGLTFSYQWYRNSTAIAGARGASYLVSSVDSGARLKVEVTASAPGYRTAKHTSKQTAKVKA
ncbi:MAG: hypothetical protein QM619_13880 [Micropruina sp.]|uniref:hypothetical protein n=1 Tax=Micropruina sp. TaxID=2737536 RepID=UPI0039E59800